MEVFLPSPVGTCETMVTRIASFYPASLGESPLTRKAASLLARYFAGEKVKFELPVDQQGLTSFQKTVYRVVAGIPYGEMKSYAEVARDIQRPRGARGIGSAMARNPLPIIIPCHRVVGSSGAMTGYSAPGGIETKKWLLMMEGAGRADVK